MYKFIKIYYILDFKYNNFLKDLLRRTKTPEFLFHWSSGVLAVYYMEVTGLSLKFFVLSIKLYSSDFRPSI